MVELFRSRFDSAQIARERDYRTALTLPAYAHQIRQVVANLLSTAHDAMRGGGALKIRIRNSGSWDSPETTASPADDRRYWRRNSPAVAEAHL